MSTQQNLWDPNSAVTGKLIMSECNLLMIFKDLGVAGLPLQVKASGRKCRCWPATPRSWNVRARFSRGSAYQASPAPVVTKFPGVALRVDIEKAQLESVQTSSKIRLCTCLQSKTAKSIQRSFTQPKKELELMKGLCAIFQAIRSEPDWYEPSLAARPRLHPSQKKALRNGQCQHQLDSPFAMA